MSYALNENLENQIVLGRISGVEIVERRMRSNARPGSSQLRILKMLCALPCHWSNNFCKSLVLRTAPSPGPGLLRQFTQIIMPPTDSDSSQPCVLSSQSPHPISPSRQNARPQHLHLGTFCHRFIRQNFNRFRSVGPSAVIADALTIAICAASPF